MSHAQISAKDREQLFWAAAALDVTSAGALDALGSLLAGLRVEDVVRGCQARLFQAHMALERLAAPGRLGEKEGTRSPLALLPGELLVHAEAAWRCTLADAAETQVRGSRTHA